MRSPHALMTVLLSLSKQQQQQQQQSSPPPSSASQGDQGEESIAAADSRDLVRQASLRLNYQEHAREQEVAASHGFLFDHAPSGPADRCFEAAVLLHCCRCCSCHHCRHHRRGSRRDAAANTAAAAAAAPPQPPPP